VTVSVRLGSGMPTSNVACTVWPLSTAPNDVGDAGVADQPDGSRRSSFTFCAGSTPSLVNDTVTGCAGHG
jgi:hypothetical protein